MESLILHRETNLLSAFKLKVGARVMIVQVRRLPLSSPSPSGTHPLAWFLSLHFYRTTRSPIVRSSRLLTIKKRLRSSSTLTTGKLSFVPFPLLFLDASPTLTTFERLQHLADAVSGDSLPLGSKKPSEDASVSSFPFPLLPFSSPF